MKKIVLCIFLTVGFFVCVNALTCEKCGTYECNNIEEEKCPAGRVTDICNCCLVCGKKEGDICGGAWNMKGKCGKDLFCKKVSILPHSTGICHVID